LVVDIDLIVATSKLVIAGSLEIDCKKQNAPKDNLKNLKDNFVATCLHVFFFFLFSFGVFYVCLCSNKLEC